MFALAGVPGCYRLRVDIGVIWHSHGKYVGRLCSLFEVIIICWRGQLVCLQWIARSAYCFRKSIHYAASGFFLGAVIISVLPSVI